MCFICVWWCACVFPFRGHLSTSPPSHSQRVISEIWHHRSAYKGPNTWAQVQADTHTHTYIYSVTRHESIQNEKRADMHDATTVCSKHWAHNAMQVCPCPWRTTIRSLAKSPFPCHSPNPLLSLPIVPLSPRPTPTTRAAIVLNATDKLSVRRGWWLSNERTKRRHDQANTL